MPSSDFPAPRVDRLKTLLGAAIGAACLWLAFRRVPVAEVWRSVATVRVLPVALAVATIVLATALRAWRWRLLFPVGDREVGFRRLWPILLVGHMMNILLPARLGDLARLYLVERTERRAVAQTLGTLAVEKALDGLVFLAMLWALSLWADFPGTLSRAGDAVSLTLGIVLVSVGLVVLLGDRALGAIARSAALPDRLKQLLLERWLTPLVEGFAGRRRVGAVLSAVTLSFGVWGAGWLANYFCLTALAVDRAALAALLVLVVLQLGTAVPMSPGNLGVFEYLCVLALGILAVPQSVAVSYGILLHVVAYLPPVALGAAIIGLKILPWAGRSGRTRSPEPGT